MDAAGLRTAHGGLLRLLQVAGSAALDGTAAGEWWRRAVAPVTAGPGFQLGFHIAVGLAMAVFYVAVVRRLPPRRVWPNALAYAAAVWLLNAAVVLPVIGEGFAGSKSLGVAGMTAFAAIHTAFFVLLAGFYRKVTAPSCSARVAPEALSSARYANPTS